MHRTDCESGEEHQEAGEHHRQRNQPVHSCYFGCCYFAWCACLSRLCLCLFFTACFFCPFQFLFFFLSSVFSSLLLACFDYVSLYVLFQILFFVFRCVIDGTVTIATIVFMISVVVANIPEGLLPTVTVRAPSFSRCFVFLLLPSRIFAVVFFLLFSLCFPL